ncbi:hypothetical protein A1O1_07455 [Capronia coronata CBS 617.96]|uniref:Thioredoxin domain-containing protein n=1 Tax=Capronia coronata CBS 617.96 TaxID=1182541 RepID=W9XUD6_9EURO|nr:uncharacterized protein A1O1_07455 [Capronia coronata CBS 617.96]EXJ83828.1 hypothetical protein A1O1_07455 [Capronia coronata CBS 617.96]
MGSGEDEGEGKGHRDNDHEVPGDEEDVDAVLASLEEEEHSTYRAQRLQELNDSAARSKPTTTLDASKKTYITLNGDDEALSFTTENERAVLHFYHPDFARCLTMDRHCEQIAEKHAENAEADVSFARVDVKKAPFVVEKLGVRVLPCVVGFVKGVVKGRVTGFEGLCWDGKENSITVTRALEEAIVGWSVLRKRLLLGHDDEDTDEENEGDGLNGRKSARRGIRGRQPESGDEDDDWD